MFQTRPPLLSWPLLSATQPALPEGSPPKPQRFRLSPKQCETQDRESWQRALATKWGRMALSQTPTATKELYPQLPHPTAQGCTLPCPPLKILPGLLPESPNASLAASLTPHPHFVFVVLCSDATPGLGDHSVLGLKPTT